MENSSQGLTLFDPDRKVVVTGEEHHQPALAGYAPRGDGRARRVAVELCLTRVGRIEVRLDGRRVGELTELMSRRYGPHVDAILRRRERPGAVALVVDGRRGVEMELRLPEVTADDVVDVTAPLPPLGPRPAPRRPDGGRPPARPRRLRKPLLIGAGVFALLVAIGAVSGGEEEVRDTATPSISAAARPAPATTPVPTTTRVLTTTPVTTTTPAPVTTPAPTIDPDRDSVAVPPAAVTRAPQTRDTAPAVQRAAPDPEPRVAPEPAPRAEPEPQRAAAAAPDRSTGCHPSYSGCLPDGPDLDCGDIDGPVTVTGPDEYRLDADNDGTGCEG